MNNEKADSVIICRCEEITRAEIEAAIARGADNINDIKRMTRAGMGLCQGKTCMNHIHKIALENGLAEAAYELQTNRAPVRPLKLKNLIQCDEPF